MTPSWQLHHGDCLAWLRTLKARSVDHTITDPPYSEHVHSNARSGQRKIPLLDGKGRTIPANAKRGISRGVDFGFDHATPELIRDVSKQLARVTRRWIAVFSDVESCHLWRQGLERAGARYLRSAFWHKVGGAPQFSGDRPAQACEVITLAHGPEKISWNGRGKQGFYPVPIELNRGNHTMRHHPTAKPIALMLELVEDFTDPGDLILDPFAGSGTTGAAALRLGRSFLGAERKDEHHETARLRLTDEQHQTDHDSRTAGQIALFEGTDETEDGSNARRRAKAPRRDKKSARYAGAGEANGADR